MAKLFREELARTTSEAIMFSNITTNVTTNAHLCASLCVSLCAQLCYVQTT